MSSTSLLNRAPDDNVVDFFSGQPLSTLAQQRIIRLAPENDGLCMLYSNQANPEKLFSMNLLCWALRNDGEIVGMVPWLNKMSSCPDLQDPLNGQWEGYYDPLLDEIFEDPPLHKIVELETSAEYFEDHCQSHGSIIQEIRDNIGTHAMFASDNFHSLTLTEILSWRLFDDGHISAMLVDQDKVNSTPVLPGDDSLYAADSLPNFKYFFQHHIANQIKAEDPAALAAIALLIDE